MRVGPARQDAAARAPEAWAESLDRAILHSLLYAGLFEYAPSLDELHRRLMDVAADPAELRERLTYPYLSKLYAITDGWIHPRGREAWVGLGAERRERSRRLVGRHRRVLRLLAALPYVRLVALSGACAHDNATDDDVDVFLVVRRGRAWSVFHAVIWLSKLLGVRRTLCVNYVIDETRLALAEHDTYTAAEIVGMRPLAGRATYRRFVATNCWIARRFPNFWYWHWPASEAVREVACPRWLERVFDVGPAPLFEAVSRKLLGWWLRRSAGSGEGVALEPTRLKLHSRDHRQRLDKAFERVLDAAEGAA